MKNFKQFLSIKGRRTDPASIARLVKKNFCKFYQNHQMFLYIGDNLNRSTYQIYLRIKDLCHEEKRDRVPASEDTFILKKAKALRANGVYRRFPIIAATFERNYRQISSRHQTLKGALRNSSPELVAVKVGLSKLVDDYHSTLASPDDIPYDSFAEALGCSKETLEKYWVEEGKRKYIRSKLPPWTLKDSDLLLGKIADSGEESIYVMYLVAIQIVLLFLLYILLLQARTRRNASTSKISTKRTSKVNALIGNICESTS